MVRIFAITNKENPETPIPLKDLDVSITWVSEILETSALAFLLENTRFATHLKALSIAIEYTDILEKYKENRENKENSEENFFTDKDYFIVGEMDKISLSKEFMEDLMEMIENLPNNFEGIISLSYSGTTENVWASSNWEGLNPDKENLCTFTQLENVDSMSMYFITMKTAMDLLRKYYRPLSSLKPYLALINKDVELNEKILFSSNPCIFAYPPLALLNSSDPSIQSEMNNWDPENYQ